MPNGPIAAVELQPSEAHVLAAASRLFAAHISAGHVSRESEESIMEHCIKTAIRMALRIDRLLQSEDETLGLGARDRAV
jgi:hypothetical protein